MQLVFEVQQLLLLAFEQLRDRHARPAADDAGDIVFVHLFLDKRAAVLMREPPPLRPQLFLQLARACRISARRLC